MAIKTSFGWRQKRRPETAEAVKRFEEKTGLKVISARCRPTGSMRPYVCFIIKKNYEEIAADFYNGKDFDKPRLLNGVEIKFIRRANVEGTLTGIDVQWESLGMAQPF